MSEIIAAAGAQVPEEPRDIEVIATEIIYLKNKAGEAILEIGKRLIEAKAQLQHGEWLPWLRDNVDISEDSAQRYMKIAREWSNTDSLRYLNLSKALKLVELEPAEREAFMAEKHDVGGEEKTVYEMTIKELKESLKARESEIERLKAEPKAVTAVEQVPDKERERELEDNIAALKDRLKETKEKLKDAENAKLAEQRSADSDRKIAAEREASLKAQLEKAQKSAAVSGDADVAAFKVHFNEAQQHVSEMSAIIVHLGGSDPALAEKLKNAARAFFTKAGDDLG